MGAKHRDNNNPNIDRINNKLGKFSSFLLVLAIMGLIASFASIFSIVFVVFYYFILIVIAFLTLFSLLLNENFKKLLSGGENFQNILMTVKTIIPYIITPTIAISIIALILFIVNKNYYKRKSRIGLCVVVLILSVIIALTQLIKIN